MTPPGSTKFMSGIFRFHHLESGHEVISHWKKHGEKLSYDIKVTKTIANARLAQKSVLGHPFTDPRGHICPLTSPRSSKDTRVENGILTITFDLIKLERWIKHHRVCLVTGFLMIYGKVIFWPFVTPGHIRLRGDLWRSNHWRELFMFHIAGKGLTCSYQMYFTRSQ